MLLTKEVSKYRAGTQGEYRWLVRVVMLVYTYYEHRVPRGNAQQQRRQHGDCLLPAQLTAQLLCLHEAAHLLERAPQPDELEPRCVALPA